MSFGNWYLCEKEMVEGALPSIGAHLHFWQAVIGVISLAVSQLLDVHLSSLRLTGLCLLAVRELESEIEFWPSFTLEVLMMTPYKHNCSSYPCIN